MNPGLTLAQGDTLVIYYGNDNMYFNVSRSPLVLLKASHMHGVRPRGVGAEVVL